MLPYRRRRFREESDDDVSAMIAGAVAQLAPPPRPADPATSSSQQQQQNPAGESHREDDEYASMSPPQGQRQRQRRHPSPLQIDDPTEAADAVVELPDGPDAGIAAAAATAAATATPAAASASPAGAGRDSSESAASESAEQASASPAAASRSARPKARHSLEGTGRKARVDVFVQRCDARRAGDAYEQLFNVLYPSYEPSTTDSESLDSSLAALLDEWTEEVNGSMRSVRLDNVRAGGANDNGGGKYQMYSAIDQSDSHRPLVIGSAHLREIMAQPFDELSATFAQSAAAPGAVGMDDDDDEEADDAAAGVQPSRVRMQLQSAVRPLLEQILSLHQVTLPDTPLRDRLRETLSALACASYGFETSLFARSIECFKSVSTSTSSPALGDLALRQMLEAVLAFAFHFRAQMDGHSREALAGFLLHFLRAHMGALTPVLHLSMLESARLSETGSAGATATAAMASDLVLPHVVKGVPAQLLGWCTCGRAGPDSIATVGALAAAASPSAAGGRARSARASAALSPLSSSSARAAAAAARSGEVAVAACVLCQREASESAAHTPLAVASLCVQRMVDSVVQAKSTEGEMAQFLRARCGASLGSSILALSSSFCPAPAAAAAASAAAEAGSPSRPLLGRAEVAALHGHMLCNMMLLGCKWIQDLPHGGESLSQATRRQVHGLRLVLQVQQWSGGYFLSCPRRLLLLRGVLIPSVLSCCLGSFRAATSLRRGGRGRAHFALVLRLVTRLVEQFAPFLPAELGLLLQHALLPMLTGPLATLGQKHAILLSLDDLFSTPHKLLLAFLNWDYNHARHEEKMIEALFAALVRVLEGDVEALPVAGAAAADETGGTTAGGNGAGGAGDDDHDDEGGEEEEEEDDSECSPAVLSQSALQLLVHLMSLQAQWLGVPGLKRSGAVPLPLRNKESNKEVWHALLNQHRREQQIDDQVLQLAHSGRLKAALRYQSQVKACTATVDQMAAFLMETDSLNKADVGDFLANLDDDFLTKQQYDELRRCYVSRLDFAGQSFDEALRLFLCDSGFRLPGEAQKIDRMLEAFCQRFVADNPGVFRNSSSAFIVCFALVMLNTDLHDPRLRSGKSSRKPMSLEQFVSNLRGVDEGRNFPRAFLKNMFARIQERAIEWKEESQHGSAAQEQRKNSSVSAAAAHDRAQAQLQLEEAARASSNQRRIVLHKLSRTLCLRRSWCLPAQDHAWLVAPLYDSSWFRALGTFSLLREQEPHLILCLDGLAYGTAIAIVLGARTPTNAYLNVLAKLTFVETARSEHRKKMDMEEILRRQRATPSSPAPGSPALPVAALPLAQSRADSDAAFRSQMERAITRRAHQKQSWFSSLSSVLDLDDAEAACVALFHVCSVTKKQLNQERRFVRVQQLQDVFGDGVSLRSPNREVLREGLLWRCKAPPAGSSPDVAGGDAPGPAANGAGAVASSPRPFYFFLLTDLLIIASDGGDSTTPYKWKHAFHLSMLRCEDLPTQEEQGQHDDTGSSIFPFTLTTAQSASPLHLAAADASTRAKWIAAIEAQRTMLSQRQSSCVALRALPPSKRLSAFVGAPLSLGMDAALTVVDPAHHCRLCLRALHPIFRRGAQCTWCGGPVCSKCCQKRIRLPPNMLAQCSVQRVNASASPMPPDTLDQPSPPEPTVTSSASSGAEQGHPSPSPSPPEPSDGAGPAAGTSERGGSSSGSFSSTLGAFGSASLSSFSSSSSAFLSKLNSAAQASVSSMHSKLRQTIGRLNDKEGVAVCDACATTLPAEL